MLARFTLPAIGLALAVLPAACAPPSAGMAGPAPSASLSGPANAGGAPMMGMDHSGMNMPGMDMKNMDMGTMMSHCAQMRQQASAGQTPQGKQMLDQCDQMDRSMGMTPPARR